MFFARGWFRSGQAITMTATRSSRLFPFSINTPFLRCKG
nr:MAG TPA: hypothetical protein [Caudoviricetes sp.]